MSKLALVLLALVMQQAQSPAVDPQGPEAGAFRVKRGGAWMFSAAFARSTARDLFAPSYRFNYVGFRVVRTRR